MIEEIGEVKSQQALSDFSCEISRDVESFLLDKAVIFAKQNVSQTHIVMNYSPIDSLLCFFYDFSSNIAFDSNPPNILQER